MTTTTLKAVNRVLRRVGKPVVAALDTNGGSLASYAERELDDASVLIQTEGWSWNTRNGKEVTATDGQFVLSTFESGADLILSASTSEASEPNVTLANTVLNNADTNSTTFTETTLKLDYVYLRPITEIPEAFVNWIVSHAALRLSRQFYGNPSLEQLISAEIIDARRIAIRDEIRVSETNVLDTTNLRQIRGRPRMRDRSING